MWICSKCSKKDYLIEHKKNGLMGRFFYLFFTVSKASS
jgi:hypothetical protein